MIKGLIFDLDQTLVDSSIAEVYRSQRNWEKVYSLIPRFGIYEGFSDVFRVIRQKGIRICVVTTSPGRYALKVINHFQIPCDFVVDYFATKMRKPHPEPMYEACKLLSLPSTDILSFGDKAIDIQSSNSAGIKSVACLWGTNEKNELLLANPNFRLKNPPEIIQLFDSINNKSLNNTMSNSLE